MQSLKVQHRALECTYQHDRHIDRSSELEELCAYNGPARRASVRRRSECMREVELSRRVSVSSRCRSSWGRSSKGPFGSRRTFEGSKPCCSQGSNGPDSGRPVPDGSEGAQLAL